MHCIIAGLKLMNIKKRMKQTPITNTKSLNPIVCLTMLGMLISATAIQAQTMVVDSDYVNAFPKDDPYCDASNQLAELNPEGTEGLPVDQASRTPCPNIVLPESSTIPSSVVDWVLVELRSGANSETVAQDASTIVARKPAFVLSNGRVVDAEAFVGLPSADISTCANIEEDDNCPEVSFTTEAFGGESPTLTGDTFVVIRHRNHLDIIGANALPLASNAGGYDFTTSADTARGGIAALKNKSNTFAMISGDPSGDGNVEFNDSSAFIVPDGGISGYDYSDMNFTETLSLTIQVHLQCQMAEVVPK